MYIPYLPIIYTHTARKYRQYRSIFPPDLSIFFHPYVYPPEMALAQHPPSPPRKPSNRLVRALTNPNFSALLPPPKPSDPTAKRLEDWKLARAIGARNVDFGPSAPLPPHVPVPLPDADAPLFAVDVPPGVLEKLPAGYCVRSLQRDDWDRGYCDLKFVSGVGRENVTRAQWDERCAYLSQRGDTYTVLVMLSPSNTVVATGTLVVVRKFGHGMALAGQIEDIAVAAGQSGKNLGGRMLEALDGVAGMKGCYKTVVCCQEGNVGFHAQRGFRATGVEMVGLVLHVRELD